jgi:hypothetical protein
MSGTGLNLQKQSATDLVDACLRQSRELNALLLEIERRRSAADLEAARKIVGRIMGEIYVAALYPIFEQYPDLKRPGFP